jgi:hypothetical protein
MTEIITVQVKDFIPMCITVGNGIGNYDGLQHCK